MDELEGEPVTMLMVTDEPPELISKFVESEKMPGWVVIDEDQSSFETFKAEFSKAAATVFGSGWAWLCVGADGKLLVTKTANQDNPISTGAGSPILGLDVWEHSYYLGYQNRRPDYIEAWWNVVDWDRVNNVLSEL